MHHQHTSKIKEQLWEDVSLEYIFKSESLFSPKETSKSYFITVTITTQPQSTS